MKDKIIDSAANTHKTDAVNTNTTFSTDKAVHTPCYDIPLELIDPNPDNPRKHFGDEELKQLAATIERYGVIQPVLVHPVRNEQTGATRFMLVHGERRTRASIIAGKDTIPAFIKEMPADRIEALALLENLHRVDISEFELATVFHKMVCEEGKEIAAVADEFGVSTKFIRNRILLLELIPDLRNLLDEEAITMSMALELCKYDRAVQEDVYEKHLKSNCEQGSWRPLKKAEFTRKMVETYSAVLDHYTFDKTECAACSYNTGLQMDLFGCVGNCTRCLNRECLQAKINIHLFETIAAIVEKEPLTAVAVRSNIFNKEVVGWLKDYGIAIHTIDFSDRFFNPPTRPDEPVPGQYKNTGEYETAKERYRIASDEYHAEMTDITERVSTGKLKTYLLVRDKDFMYVYEDLSKSGQAAETPVATLKKQDERNLEISRNNIIKNTVKVFTEHKVPAVDITETEDKYLYLAMLDAIRDKFIPLLRLKNIGEKALDEDKMTVVNKLTAKQKILVKRVFLMSALSVAAPDSPRYTLLEEFARTFYPDQFAEIRKKHMDVYEKRHNAIEAKLAEVGSVESAESVPNAQEEVPQQKSAPKEAELPRPVPDSEPAPATKRTEEVPTEYPETGLEDWEQILIETEPEPEEPFDIPEPPHPQEPEFLASKPEKDVKAA